MPRGGGGGGHGGGGHSHSGGHSSSSHHSSSGGSRGGMSHSSHSSGFSKPMGHGPGGYGGPMGHGPGPRPYVPHGPHYSHTTVVYRDGNSSNKRVSVFVTIAIIVIILITFGCLMRAPSSSSSGVTKSTIEREALEKDYCTAIDEWFDDRVDGVEDASALKSGLKYFYNKTGIQPYVLITNEDISDEYVSNLYDELFNDSGHILFAFVIDGYKDTWYSYDCWFETGNAAGTVFDDEAKEIFYDYLDRNWSNTNLKNGEFLGKTFEKTADRIMTVTPNYGFRIILVIAAVAIVLIAFKWWKKAKAQKNLEAEQTEKILNADLNTFSNKDKSDDLDELAKKYEDKKDDIYL